MDIEYIDSIVDYANSLARMFFDGVYRVYI